MMNHLTIYVGKNVEKLKFHMGNSEPRVGAGHVYLNAVRDTPRANPYPDVHDSVFCESLAQEMGYTLPHWNMHISTHRHAFLDLVGELLRKGLLFHEDVSVILLNEDNHPFSCCGYDTEGYLTDGWVAGFLGSSGDEWRKFK